MTDNMPKGTIPFLTDKCPVCKTELDMSTPADGTSKPREGDFSMCVYCESILTFVGPDLRLAEPTAEKLRTISPANREVLTEARKAIGRMNDVRSILGLSRRP